MSDELDYVNDMEHAERLLAKFLKKARKDGSHLKKHTKHEERDIKHGNHDAEIKDDGFMEHDVYKLLLHLIKGFKGFIKVEKDLVELEKDEGEDAVRKHDNYKQSIEQELGYLIKELRRLRSSEGKI